MSENRVKALDLALRIISYGDENQILKTAQSFYEFLEGKEVVKEPTAENLEDKKNKEQKEFEEIHKEIEKFQKELIQWLK